MRSRVIRPEFWTDQKLADRCSIGARMLFIGTWMIASDNGVFLADARHIKAETFRYDSKIGPTAIARWLLELERGGFIVKFETRENPYYYIPNFLKHQEINRPSKWKYPDPPKELLSEYSLSTQLPLNPQTETETETETKEQAQPPKKTSARRPDFDLVSETIHKNTGQQPSAATVQKILTLCEKADIDPVGVIGLAEKQLLSPVAWVQTACADPDGWLDRAGGWGKFQQRLNHSRDGPVTLDTTGPEALGETLKRILSQGGKG
jgi:hypothetical protein